MYTFDYYHYSLSEIQRMIHESKERILSREDIEMIRKHIGVILNDDIGIMQIWLPDLIRKIQVVINTHNIQKDKMMDEWENRNRKR